MKPKQHRQIEASGGLLPRGQALVPGLQPGRPQGPLPGRFQPGQHGWHQLVGPGQQGHSLQVEIQIFRSGGPQAHGVYARGTEAEKIVEDDRMQGGAEIEQALGRAMQMATFVGGTDQKHPHVMGGSGGNGGAIVLAEPIPMEVDVVETIACDRCQDQIEGCMGRETHVADSACGLPATGHLQTASGPQGLLQQLGGVDAMQAEQVHPGDGQPLKTDTQLGLKFRGFGLGRNFGLQDPLGIKHLGQQFTQLAFGAAVAPGGFDVMQTGGRGRLQNGPQIGLAFGIDLGCAHIGPTLLKAHASQGKQGHGQVGASEPTGRHLHGLEVAGRGRVRLGRAGVGTPRGIISCSSRRRSRAGSSS